MKRGNRRMIHKTISDEGRQSEYLGVLSHSLRNLPSNFRWSIDPEEEPWGNAGGPLELAEHIKIGDQMELIDSKVFDQLFCPVNADIEIYGKPLADLLPEDFADAIDWYLKNGTFDQFRGLHLNAAIPI